MPLERRNKNGYVVKITEDAFMEMCLSALEAYVVSESDDEGDKQDPVETYGQIWGNQATMRNGRTVFTIKKVTIDTSAERTPGACIFEPEALAVKTNFVEAFFPDIEFMGDFHTHPYLRETRDIKKGELYEFSNADKRSVEKEKTFKELPYRVGLVMTLSTVANQEPLPTLSARIKEDYSLMEFHFNNYRIWLQAYVTYLTPQGNRKLTKDNLWLEVPAIHGLECPFGNFGFYNYATREHICEEEN